MAQSVMEPVRDRAGLRSAASTMVPLVRPLRRRPSWVLLGVVLAAVAAGKPVFVDFTAAWCVTCQVNEKVAFASPAVSKAFEKSGMVYLKGDWTRKDAVIEAELARHGRAGVPLYLVYPAKGGAPVVLPQLLTEGLVLEAIKTAAPPPSR